MGKGVGVGGRDEAVKTWPIFGLGPRGVRGLLYVYTFRGVAMSHFALCASRSKKIGMNLQEVKKMPHKEQLNQASFSLEFWNKD